MRLTPIQRLVARRLGGGEGPVEVARLMKFDVSNIHRWYKEVPGFLEAVELATQEHEAVVTALLVAGETRASETLLSALEATTTEGEPNWRIRVQAAVNLLDRAGQRGAPIARQQIQANVNSNAVVQTTLVSALRDPTVRAWLIEEPKFAGVLKGVAEAEVVAIEPQAEVESGLSQESGS